MVEHTLEQWSEQMERSAQSRYVGDPCIERDRALAAVLRDAAKTRDELVAIREAATKAWDSTVPNHDVVHIIEWLVETREARWKERNEAYINLGRTRDERDALQATTDAVLRDAGLPTGAVTDRIRCLVAERDAMAKAHREVVDDRDAWRYLAQREGKDLDAVAAVLGRQHVPPDDYETTLDAARRVRDERDAAIEAARASLALVKAVVDHDNATGDEDLEGVTFSRMWEAAQEAEPLIRKALAAAPTQAQRTESEQRPEAPK